MPFYSGGNFRTTFTCATGTRQEIVTGAQTVLSANGWTVVSGGGTADVVLQSATPAGGSAIRLRVTDPGSGNCAQCKIQNQAGGNESQAYYLLPAAGKTFTAFGCQYQAFIQAAGIRGYFGCGALYVPNWLRASVTEALWAQGNAISDTDTVGCSAFNWKLHVSAATGNANIRWSGILNGTLINRSANNGAAAIGDMCTAVVAGALVPATTPPRRFYDDTLFQTDPYVAFSVAANANGEAKFAGAVWDAAIVTDTFTGNTSRTIDGRTFYSVTDATPVSPGVGQVVGSLFCL